jgi:hypothetical protein
MLALTHANRVRFSRSEFKHELRGLDRIEGRQRLAEMLQTCPWFIRSASVGEVLQWAQRSGPAWMRRVCGECEINPARRVGDLTPRQVGCLVSALTGGSS